MTLPDRAPILTLLTVRVISANTRGPGQPRWLIALPYQTPEPKALFNLSIVLLNPKICHHYVKEKEMHSFSLRTVLRTDSTHNDRSGRGWYPTVRQKQWIHTVKRCTKTAVPHHTGPTSLSLMVPVAMFFPVFLALITTSSPWIISKRFELGPSYGSYKEEMSSVIGWQNNEWVTQAKKGSVVGRACRHQMAESISPRWNEQFARLAS